MDDIINATRLELGYVVEIDGNVARLCRLDTEFDAPPSVHFDEEVENGTEYEIVELGEIVDVHGIFFRLVLDEDGNHVFRSLEWEFENVKVGKP